MSSGKKSNANSANADRGIVRTEARDEAGWENKAFMFAPAADDE
jgi:hypothetical protein